MRVMKRMILGIPEYLSIFGKKRIEELHRQLVTSFPMLYFALPCAFLEVSE